MVIGSVCRTLTCVCCFTPNCWKSVAVCCKACGMTQCSSVILLVWSWSTERIKTSVVYLQCNDLRCCIAERLSEMLLMFHFELNYSICLFFLFIEKQSWSDCCRQQRKTSVWPSEVSLFSVLSVNASFWMMKCCMKPFEKHYKSLFHKKLCFLFSWDFFIC